MIGDPSDAAKLVARSISRAGISIYDPLEGERSLYFTVPLLQVRLREALIGSVLTGPIRTRSLLAKRAVAAAMGYPAPNSFARVRPRFPGQNLDVAVQLANNFQVWNEEIDAIRRYAFLRPNVAGRITGVRVVTGDVIAALDTTGTLTSKYQASRRTDSHESMLVAEVDTIRLQPFIGSPMTRLDSSSSIADPPTPGRVLPIKELFGRLVRMLGSEVPDPGNEQDRLRGEGLQKAVAAALDVGRYENLGQWPDIRSQAVEVKLQTARTIDLGLVLPSSTAPVEMLAAGLLHCDVRYVVFYGSTSGRGSVRLDALVVATGDRFFDEFRQFGGLEINRKLQIRLPGGFFDAE